VTPRIGNFLSWQKREETEKRERNGNAVEREKSTLLEQPSEGKNDKN